MATTAPETTLCTFRKRFLSESEALFVQVLSIAWQMKLLKLHANASRHSALSYDHVQKIEAQLQAEVQELLAMTWNIRRMAPLRALARG